MNSAENLDDLFDADHNRRYDGDDVINDADAPSYRNASHLSRLRFLLRKRSRTLQNLLEKMFENELKNNL